MFKTKKCGLNRNTENLEIIKGGCEKNITGPHDKEGKVKILARRDNVGKIIEKFTNFEILTCESCFNKSKNPTELEETEEFENKQ